jgi:hypothetical protein
VQKAFAFGKFLGDAWDVITNPDPFIERIYAAFGSMLVAVPPSVASLITTRMAGRGKSFSKHLEGIWGHLAPKLEVLAKDWRHVLRETAWDLIWPWEGVKGDLAEIWHRLKSFGSNVWDCEFDKAKDDILAIVGLATSVANRLYGWFAIAAILIGAFFFGGLPGAIAGAKIALAVGEGLVIATIAIEGMKIIKSIQDLSSRKQTAEENQNDYEIISSSGLTLGILGAMTVLGAIASRFAMGIFSRTAGLFKKSPKPEVPKLQLPKGETPKLEPPKADAPTAEIPTPVEGKGAAPREGKGAEPKTEKPESPGKDLGTQAGKKVLAEKPTADGQHQVKVTEEGIRVCSPSCPLLIKDIDAAVLENPALKQKLDPLRKRLETAQGELESARLRQDRAVDPQEAAKAAADVEKAAQAAADVAAEVKPEIDKIIREAPLPSGLRFNEYETPEAAIGMKEGKAKLVGSDPVKEPALRNQGYTDRHYYRDLNDKKWSVDVRDVQGKPVYKEGKLSSRQEFD